MIEEKTTMHNRSNKNPIRYEMVSRNGTISQVKFKTAAEAAAYARECFPDQEQDEERSGKGWDVQVVGADR